MNNFDKLWPFPPTDQPELLDNEIHVWRVSLDLPASTVQRLRTVLTEDELHRADRFRFPKSRIHFTVARGVLRTLLGQYLNTLPESIRFEYNQYGKPALSPADNTNDLRFNLSHSGEMALYAMTRHRDVGIDIERIREVDQAENIAKRYFSDKENSEFHNVPPHLRQQAFFNCWTRKEAYIKAKGKGLALPLHQFDVSLVPGEPAKLLEARDDLHQPIPWTMQELFPGSGYVAALIAEGNDWHVKYWQYL